MNKIVFIKNQDGHVYAVDQTEITNKPLADVYGNYGEQFGHADAGDYFLLNEEMKGILKEEMPFIIHNEEHVSAFENSAAFDLLMERGFAPEQDKALVYEYHDGHNFRSCILECDQEVMNEWSLIEEGEEYENWLDLINNGQRVESAYGHDIKLPDSDFYFSVSYFQGRIGLGQILYWEKDAMF